jgi:hypothetical protein
MHIDGFVIVPPLNTWDEKDRETIIPRMSYKTFALTATEAWARHTQIQPSDDDFSKIVQTWHDHGYRLREATMLIKEYLDGDGNKIDAIF